MKHRLVTYCALGGIAAVSLVVFASPADMIEDKFKAFDTNHDGVISGDELDASPILRRLDLNGDGKLTLEEAREAMAQYRGAIAEKLKEKSPGQGMATELVFKRLDKNGDGRLTADELTDKTWFDKLDVNKDGYVTLEEAKQVVGEMVPQRILNKGLPQTSGVAETDLASFKEQPEQLKGTELGIGRKIEDKAIVHDKNAKAVVLALFNATCPISNKLAPEVARLEKDYADKDVTLLLVNTSTEAKSDEAQKFISEHGLKSAVIPDSGQSLQRELQASTTTEVFVLDAAHTLLYRGAINDQYGLGYTKEAAKKNYLRDAVEAVLNHRLPEISATTAPGCALDLTKPEVVANHALTYHKDISRILQTNCVSCHHQDGIAPFSLETLADVKEHAGMIKKQVDRGAMPPWFAAKQEGRSHEWANDRALSERDKKDLLAWLNSDRAEGDLADAPLPRKYEEQWMIGKPDAVVEVPKPIQVKAEGVMPYQRTVIETSFPEDRWVQAYEVAPSARAVVHHVIVNMHEKGSKLIGRDNGAEGFWAAYVPGNSYRVMPEGFAKRLPAGAKLTLQIHYTPNGKATQDQIKIGLIFAKQPPQYEVHVTSLAQPRLSIPPGAANHVVTKEQVIPANMMLTGYMAHMHVRGKAFKYEVTTPDGKTETLLDIPRYDFNWQLQYDLAQPKFIPAGSTVKITAVFDNSAGNPANPDPTKTVHWGEQTYDEMMIGYVEHFTPLAGAKVAAK